MTQALLRNTFREISNTKARFISIMAIIALGVGFFAGIKATSPSMYNLAETYYSEQNLMDYRLVSTGGFSRKDVMELQKLDGVSSVMPSFFYDAALSAKQGGQLIHLIALPRKFEKSIELNSVVLTEGRLPENYNEILTEGAGFGGSSHQIGDTVTFAELSGSSKTADTLKTLKFKVVGKVRSPLYISYQRGGTAIGDGKLDEYMYVHGDLFKTERFTEVYVKADFSDKFSPFSDEYEQKSAELKKKLEAFGKERAKFFKTEAIAEAREKYNKAKKDFEEQKTKAEEQLAEAKKLLDEGEKTLNDETASAQQKLSEAKEQIEQGRETLAQSRQAAEEQMDEAEEKISSGEAKLDSAAEQLEQGRAAAEEKISSQSPELADTAKAIAEARLSAAQAQLIAGRAVLENGKAQLIGNKGLAEYELDSAQQKLDYAQSEYESGKETLESNTEEPLAELEAAKAEYEKNKNAVEDKFAEAEKKLAEGEKTLKQTEKKIKRMAQPVWYVNTRDENPGYSTFTQNADRLDAVASVFPLFFLLVAILVCVTTMTRLIEEKRTEIAVIKALGYSNRSIITKFVIYSMIAGVLGSVAGTAAGVSTLPFIIYNAYKIMYYIGDITLVLNLPVILLGILAAIFTTTAVSVIVCEKSLRLKPAQAMRPKAPKAGKRILLERFTLLWKHMGFTAKLTARNLFRYKARLCMTVIGVAGCTALIVAAFGLLNSFDPLTEIQFGEVFRYDAVAVPKKAGSEKQLEYLVKSAEKQENVQSAMLCMQEDVTVEHSGSKLDSPVTLSVFSDTENFKDMVHLRERETKKPLKLSDSGVMVNEKYASVNKLNVGDTIKVTVKGASASVKISGIYEQYINNYIYMTPGLYQKLYSKPPVYNILCVSLEEATGERAEKFSSAMLSDSRVVAVTFMAEKITEFKNMLNSLNMVVVVMIVCAAALAFVVLYNLTNINIAERIREIATFKVLGFYNRETSSFIYKENIILTLLGIAAGLGLGVLLTGFIVKTVEIDNVMFGREIYLTSYLYAAGLTMLFSLAVNAVMSFKIKAVNMVESLKSVE